MTPVQFAAENAPRWAELARALDHLQGQRKRPKGKLPAPAADDDNPAGLPDAARMTALYRLACEHLALAQARAYPITMTEQLQQLTYRAHRVIYRRQDYGVARFKDLVLIEIPSAVRLHRHYVLIAALLFIVPTLLVGWAAYRDPGFALHILSAQQLGNFRDMYSGNAAVLGHANGATGDWGRFGFYIFNNISLAFQCFSGGLFAGVGSAFFLLYNGVFGGAVAGYLTQYGYATNFYSFVITHSAFELTAICLSGAAGLRMGYAFIAPGRHSRLEALRLAAASAVVLIYAVFGMLVVAAAIEAFWSAAAWIPPSVKYGVGAAAWAAVIGFFTWQGRAGSSRGRPRAD